MLLKYKETETKLERNENAFNAIIETVNEIIEDENIVFSHLIVDGVDVYEGHEVYINERLNDLLQIEIITYKATEMIYSTVQSVLEYLNRANPALQQLVDDSYDEFSQDAWEGVSQLIEGMQWILQFKEFASAARKQPNGWDEFVAVFERVEEQFTPLLDAIEAQDTLLITDLLSYEVLPAYEEMVEHVETMSQDDDYLKDAN